MTLRDYLNGFAASGIAEGSLTAGGRTRLVAGALLGVAFLASTSVLASEPPAAAPESDAKPILDCVADYYELHRHVATNEPVFLLTTDAADTAALFAADEQMGPNHPLNNRIDRLAEDRFGVAVQIETADDAGSTEEVARLTARLGAIERDLQRLTDLKIRRFGGGGPARLTACRNLVERLDAAQRASLSAAIDRGDASARAADITETADGSFTGQTEINRWLEANSTPRNPPKP